MQEYDKARLVPREGLLIKIYKDSVLFKSLRAQDATYTSFSAYEDYGIELGLRDNYYTLPKRELSIQEVFIHSLDSAEGHQQRLFCILFYLKHKDRLEGVEHPVVKDIRAVLRGERSKAIRQWKTSRIGRRCMASSYDRITRREEVNELFEELGQVLGGKSRLCWLSTAAAQFGDGAEIDSWSILRTSWLQHICLYLSQAPVGTTRLCGRGCASA
jgi:hypothetical protein